MTLTTGERDEFTERLAAAEITVEAMKAQLADAIGVVRREITRRQEFFRAAVADIEHL